MATDALHTKPTTQPPKEGKPKPLPSFRGWPIVRFSWTAHQWANRYILSDPDTLADVRRFENPYPKDRQTHPDGSFKSLKQFNFWLYDEDDKLGEMIAAGLTEKDKEGFWEAEVFWGSRATAQGLKEEKSE